MPDCIFCNIINKKISTEFIYEDDLLVAFNDIKPSAPVHILIVSKKHIPTINDITDTDEKLMGQMILTAKKIAKDKGLDKSGYKLVFNVGRGGGQIIYHIHLHLLAGSKLKPIEY